MVYNRRLEGDFNQPPESLSQTVKAIAKGLSTIVIIVAGGAILVCEGIGAYMAVGTIRNGVNPSELVDQCREIRRASFENFISGKEMPESLFRYSAALGGKFVAHTYQLVDLLKGQ